NVAERYKISRKDQDEFAYLSQHKTGDAQKAGAFEAEIVGVPIEQRGGKSKKGDPPIVVSVDEHPRPDVTMEQLAKLKPAFREGGSVTAGNSSGINDGWPGAVLRSADEAKRRGLKPLARIVTSAVAGVDPNCMGLGPIPATRKALTRAGLHVADLDLIELNEAFAAQALACARDLELRLDRVN